MNIIFLSLLLLILLFVSSSTLAPITVDGDSTSRTFDGIGGLSGGGCTSRLLVDYPEPYKSQILDYLFKPNYGANLQILKVEIGGDGQTTDGTEPSHMHTRDDLNFDRGYEWYLMVEAKKRNPDIILYALSWCVPGWIGNGNFFSEDNVNYHVNFVKGAKTQYNLDIDYIGIWNERSYSNDKNATYIKNLRAGLDAAGFQNTKIVAADGGWGIVNSLEDDSYLKQIVSRVGVHYPGTNSPTNAQNLGTPLWASEDYSTHSDHVGSGCWARILNQNWVNGYMTSTISWNLIAAYYPGLPYTGDGLMWSYSPWSGNYVVTGTIWGSAHTTQFTKVGWKYLAHGKGSGHLPKGGSYVTLVPATNPNGDFTMVIETMTHDNSICIRPSLPHYTVDPQTVTFDLSHLNTSTTLYVWKSHFSGTPSEEIYFEKQKSITPSNNQITLTLDLDSMWTVTTLNTGNKGDAGTPPAATTFPDTYSDDFESYSINSEGKYFADQTGVWEISKQGSNNQVMRQMTTQAPITWCSQSDKPITFIGDHTRSEYIVEFDTLIEKTGTTIIGGRANKGGCGNNYESGYFFGVDEKGAYTLTAGTKVLKSGNVGNWKGAGEFNHLKMMFNGSEITAYANGDIITQISDTEFQNGWYAVGSSYDHVSFDNFKVTPLPQVPVNCGNGDNIVVVPCAQGLKWVNDIKTDGTLKVSGNDSMCLGVKGTDPNSKGANVVIDKCDSTDKTQSWSMSGNRVVNGNGDCLDITGQSTKACTNVELWECNGGSNQQWSFDSNSRLVTQLDDYCLGLGN